MSTNPKVCLDCKHCIRFETDLALSKCGLLPRPPHLVTGYVDYTFCELARERVLECGPDAKNFEAKEGV